MKGSRAILVLSLLTLSAAAHAGQFVLPPAPSSCKNLWDGIFYDIGFKQACRTYSVPEPATLGLLGVSLIGFAVKRRRK